MARMKCILLALIFLGLPFLGACDRHFDPNAIHAGMSEADVIALCGSPRFKWLSASHVLDHWQYWNRINVYFTDGKVVKTDWWE